MLWSRGKRDFPSSLSALGGEGLGGGSQPHTFPSPAEDPGTDSGSAPFAFYPSKGVDTLCFC